MDAIEAVLKEYNTIAVVGLSDNPWRPSHSVSAYMREHGYKIIPVNPNHKTLLGVPCYPDLAAIPEPVAIVNIFRRPEAVPAIVDQAIAINARVIWMQLGVYHAEAAEKATRAGLTVIMDRCIKIEHRRIFSAS